jgi:hypothetical protein
MASRILEIINAELKGSGSFFKRKGRWIESKRKSREVWG